MEVYETNIAFRITFMNKHNILTNKEFLMKKDIEIVLKKEGLKDITVKCPQTIKLPAWRVYTAIYAGLPPLSIKPADIKGLLITVLAFFAIFVSCAFFMVSVALGIIVFGAVVAFNFVYTKNYFFNFIKKKLAEGYSPENEEQNQILKEAGVFDALSKTSSGATGKNAGGFLGKVNASIDKLPFGALARKVPGLSVVAKYANYAVCVLVIVLILGMLFSKNPVDAFIDDMENIAKSMETLVVKCENREISYEQYSKQMINLASEIDESDKKYKYNKDDITPEQLKRIAQIMDKIEKLEKRGERLELRYYLE